MHLPKIGQKNLIFPYLSWLEFVSRYLIFIAIFNMLHAILHHFNSHTPLFPSYVKCQCVFKHSWSIQTFSWQNHNLIQLYMKSSANLKFFKNRILGQRPKVAIDQQNVIWTCARETARRTMRKHSSSKVWSNPCFIVFLIPKAMDHLYGSLVVTLQGYIVVLYHIISYLKFFSWEGLS